MLLDSVVFINALGDAAVVIFSWHGGGCPTLPKILVQISQLIIERTLLDTFVTICISMLTHWVITAVNNF